MHGLINKSLQCFLCETYGEALWRQVAAQCGVSPAGFEAMLHYDDDLTDALIGRASALLERPREALLEDVGTFLASREELRRLLRFGGGDYWEFLHSLDELPDRGRMALPDLDLPGLRLSGGDKGMFDLRITAPRADWVPVLAGLLRAMADDYGALVLIEPVEIGGCGLISITLLNSAYAEGRHFDLATGSERLEMWPGASA